MESVDYTRPKNFSTATTATMTPGSDVLYVASQSLGSKRRGIFAALGVNTGIAVYVVATALGLSALLQHSALAFNVIKCVGAAYLFYLAWQAFTQKIQPLPLHSGKALPVRDAYIKGIYTNLFNPKVGLFFLTFLPQFVDAQRGKASLQMLSLGLCFIVSSTLISVLYAILFATLKQRLLTGQGVQKWLHKVTGLVLCAIAVKVLSAHQASLRV